MMSYETVKYFNAEPYEFGRYRGAVIDYQQAEYEVLVSLNLMNTAQMVCFMTGLLITCFIAGYQVTIGTLRVGKFVGLLTYMAQLQAPLNFFGTFYRSIQSALINSERMLELFKEKPTVVDSPSAEDLPSCQGDIRFNNVGFAYDKRKPALDDLSFRCLPGTTTALVGESGGGKSTVFRMLFRFYNASSGSIQVDGHDVQDVTIDSLRRHIGVVPQDTVLFNESLMYNLKYANQEATDEQVFEACRAASIHNRILGFPDGYETKVGERGLRLSGGEKQRVAIARTILKDPRIILLDEATAALDTETEQHIQAALAMLAKGRTTLIIAHRLSTITTADQILVLHAGQVAEAGTHQELIATKGRYATMWKKQIRAEKAAAEAQVLKDKADRLKSEVGTGGGTPGGDESTSQSEDEGSTIKTSSSGTLRPGTSGTIRKASSLRPRSSEDAKDDGSEIPRPPSVAHGE
jgi:ABC-type transport system involved in Fe-S cluster assembly fused permease/ATPase subunit